MTNGEEFPSRHLDPEKPYYVWSEYEGRLAIESERCMDSFAKSEELVLLEHLLQKHAVVTTLEQLMALPPLSVVLSAAGTIACRFDDRLFTVFGDERPRTPWAGLVLPARVLYSPEAVSR